MNCIIPFEGKVKFNSPVKEICSISLEHEITKNDTEVLGNFLVSGTYKEHELSVNTTDFSYTVPFSVDLVDRIDPGTLEFSIDNFTYDILDDALKLNIDYVLTADDLREEPLPEETLIADDPLDLIVENPILKENSDNDIHDIETLDSRLETDFSMPDKKVNNELELPIEENEVTIPLADKVFEESTLEPVEERNIEPNVITNIDAEDDYMIYHIHMVKEHETLESIALSYKLTPDDIAKFNDTEVLSVNDKLLIPLNNE